MSGVSQEETWGGPGIWKGDAEVCGALEMSEPESSARKPPIEEELTSLEGKPVLLSPPPLRALWDLLISAHIIRVLHQS